MKRIFAYLKKEDGAAQMIEAAIIYPIVFMCIVLLIYMGLYILQGMTLSAYAQKVALLAAREISYPGYVDMIAANDYSSYSSTAVEGDDQLFSSIKLTTDPKAVETRAYRYWLKDPIKGHTSALENIAKTMVKNNSIIGAKDTVNVTITSKNYFMVQYVTVNVTQPLMEFPVLDFFGLENPTISVSATASVNDTDEFIRNVDFAMDALEILAKKLGINTSEIRDKINDAKKTLGLN